MKMKKNFEVNGIAYELRGDKYYPTLSLPVQNNYKIGKYGLLHLDYIKAHCKGRYTTILTQGNLNSYLREIDAQAIEMMERQISLLADERGIDEKLKEQNALLWVAEMNNIKASAEEIVLKEVIYK
jgi:hypothetical protein